MERYPDYLKDAPVPVEPGNINLYTRPQVQTEDGDFATVFTTSFRDGEYEVVIPQVSNDGRIMEPEEAFRTYKETGQHLGKFKDIPEADAYSTALHKQQEVYYGILRGTIPGRIPYISEEQYKHYLENQVKTVQTNLAGAASSQDTSRERNKDTSDAPGLLSSAYQSSTLAATMYDYISRAIDNPIDPEFDWQKSFDEHKKELPEVMWQALLNAGSEAEMKQLVQDVHEKIEMAEVLERAGTLGTVAQLASSIADVDVLVGGGMFTGAFKSGAKTAFKGRIVASEALSDAAYTGVKQKAVPASISVSEALNKTSTFAGDVSKGVALGAAVGGGYGAGMYTLDPTSTGMDIVGGVMYGSLIGGGIGTATGGYSALSRGAWNDAVRKQIQDFAEASADPRIGLKNAHTQSIDDTAVFSTAPAKMKDAADTLMSQVQKGLPSKSKIADAVHKVFSKTPLASDFDKLWNSPGSLPKALAYTLFESAAGVVRNSRSAAILDSLYTSRIVTPVMDVYEDIFNQYSKSVHKAGIVQRYTDTNLRKAFHKEVVAEMSRRWNNGVPTKGVHPAIKQMCDQIDEASSNALRIGRGENGELPVRGFENLSARTGYFPLVHNGHKILEQISVRGRKSVENLITEGYKRALPELSDDILRKMSKAVIRRAEAKAKDMDTTMISHVNADPREFMKQLLIDHDVAEKEAENIVNVAFGEVPERGRAGYTKHRNPIDLDVVGDDGLTMFDLIDIDVPRVWSKYSRDVAGRAALARKGIQDRQQLSGIITAILDEDNAVTGGKGALTREYLTDLMTYFEAGPVARGVSDGVKRMKMLTNLAYLSQLGLTQAGETGAILATAGVERFLHHSSLAARMIKGAKEGVTDLAEELKFMSGSLWNDHLIYRDDLALDYARSSVAYSSPFWKTVDHLLARGQRVQGYVSGFYNIKQLQMRTAVNSQVDKVLTMLRDNDWSNLRRLQDIGFDEQYLKGIKEKYIDTGVVKWDEKGRYVDVANFGEWASKDVEAFALSIHRHTHQVVQLALAGESSVWMHKDVGSLLTQLQQFPIVAIQKQFVRNLKIGDPAALMTGLYGLATAAVAYSAKQIINGNTENLTPERISKGALNQANMTGWLPMMVDPMAHMLGVQDSISLSSYGRGSQSIIDPPSLSAANSLLRLPQALADLTVGGGLSAQDKNALQALPVVGRMYGTAWLLRAMESPAEEARRTKKRQKQQKEENK